MLLTNSQKNSIQAETREAVRAAYQAEVKAQNHTIAKRFSPGYSADEVNDGYSVAVRGKLYTKDGTLVDEPAHGYKTFGEFATDVIKAGSPDSFQSDKLRGWQNKTAGYMETGNQSQGGYLVPVGFANQILSRSLESSIVRPRATYMPMSGNRLEIPAVTDDDHSESLFAGITINKTGEGQQYQASNPKFNLIGLTLHKITGLCYVSDELLEDNPLALEQFLNIAFSQSIAFTEDELFLNGSGAGEPQGMLNSANPALVTVDAVGGQGASTVVAENIRDMWSRMYSQGKPNAIWLYNPEVFPQLFSMSMTVGTGGVPVFMPANTMSGQPYATLMGRPLIETEKCQALGTAGDIALVDPTQYIIGGKGDGTAKMATSVHLRFDYGEQAFRWTLRLDGQSWWLAPLTPKYGTKTLSPFVVLNSSRT